MKGNLATGPRGFCCRPPFDVAIQAMGESKYQIVATTHSPRTIAALTKKEVGAVQKEAVVERDERYPNPKLGGSARKGCQTNKFEVLASRS
jgi:hypothetical protein